MPKKQPSKMKLESIEFREIGTLDHREEEYFAVIGKCLIEFSKSEHNLDEAIVAALNYNRRKVTCLSKHFPRTMEEKLDLLLRFCESEPPLNVFSFHLQNRVKELDRAMALRNSLCHGYLSSVITRDGDTEFRFTRWRPGKQKYIQQISTFPKLSSIKKAIKASIVWRMLFSEIRSAVKSLPSDPH